jgi:hypothetical protein
VAREAATLLYYQQEKEYKQAKENAAHSLGTRILPSNREVAEELDRIADEIEGQPRKERLARMRKDALALMVILGSFHPRLVGSVWRGTANKDSDIDIETFHSDPKKVLETLKQNDLAIRKAEWHSVTKAKKTEKGFHVFTILPSGEAEVIVRDPEKMSCIERDEIYGDDIKGLNLHQLRRVLLQDSTRKFLPKTQRLQRLTY